MGNQKITAFVQYRNRKIEVVIGEVENGKAYVTALRGEPFGNMWTHGGWSACSSMTVPVSRLSEIKVGGVPAEEWKRLRGRRKVKAGETA